jgi:hypothetical protein
MRFSSAPIVKFGSHLPVLIKVLSLTETESPALEFGMGFNSSPVMHWMCASKKQMLVSYENHIEFFGKPFEAGRYEWDFHKVIYVDDWDKAEIEKPWGMVLIDHDPGERRVVDIRRLANYAKYLVIHDSQMRINKILHYRDIFPLFKWQYNYTDYMPHTTVLSNFVDLSNFHI